MLPTKCFNTAQIYSLSPKGEEPATGFTVLEPNCQVWKLREKSVFLPCSVFKGYLSSLAGPPPGWRLAMPGEFLCTMPSHGFWHFCFCVPDLRAPVMSLGPLGASRIILWFEFWLLSTLSPPPFTVRHLCVPGSTRAWVFLEKAVGRHYSVYRRSPQSDHWQTPWAPNS